MAFNFLILLNFVYSICAHLSVKDSFKSISYLLKPGSSQQSAPSESFFKIGFVNECVDPTCVTGTSHNEDSLILCAALTLTIKCIRKHKSEYFIDP